MDIFLRIDGISGDAKDTRHKDEIVVEAYSWGETAAPSSASGAGVGRVQMQDFTFSMKVSKASPKLMLAVATSQHFPSAVVTVRGAGGGQPEFLIWTLSNVIVTSFHTAASTGTDSVTETATLAFGRIEVELREITPAGGIGSVEKAGWDLEQNRPI